MNEFRIALSDEPGALSTLCRHLGESGVNVQAITGLAARQPYTIGLITDNDEKTTEVVQNLGLLNSVHPVLSIRLPDHAGALGGCIERMSEAGINLESIYILDKDGGKVDLALTVDQPEKARNLLKC